MKSFHFYFLAAVISLFFLVPTALAGECTPSSGYDYCWSGSWGSCTAKVQVTDVKDAHNEAWAYPMVKKAYIKVKMTGTSLYVYRGLNSWDDVYCDYDYGCNGDEISSGEYVLGTTGDSDPEFAAFVVFKQIDGNCWAWTGYGWTGNPGYYSFDIVECTQDSDCSTGQTCAADYTCHSNQPPILNSIGNKTVLVGSTLTFTISGSDPDGNSLNLTYLASNLPTGADFNASTKTFSWTPTSAGTFNNVRFTVSDGAATDFEEITITAATFVCNDGQTQACTTGQQGICGPGTQTCSSNAWGTCVRTNNPSTEICGNGIDEDCNGSDFVCPCTNGQTQACTTGQQGICGPGTQTCSSNAWGTCVRNNGPTTEICSNGIDEDCNGSDFVCPCSNGETKNCSTGQQGICGPGTQTCSSNAWGTCVRNNGPTTEICSNGIDEDCNGSDLTCHDSAIIQCLGASIDTADLKTYQVGDQYVAYDGLVPCGKCSLVGVLTDSNGKYTGGGTPTDIPCQLCHIFVMLKGISDFILFTIIPVIAVLLLTIGGVMFLISRGNPNQLSQAKAILTATIVGLVIIFAAWLIVNTLFMSIGLADWTGNLKDRWFEVQCSITLP
jgi:hypothetical protein